MNRLAWLFGVALVAIPVGIAIGSSRKSKREGSINGAVDPYDKTGDPDEDSIQAFYNAKPPADDGDCLVLGNEHPFHKFGRYRVCLTPNQKKTLFKNRKGKKLGCGVFACAYDASGKVVKFTRDSEDVAALLEAQDTGVVPKVYATYTIKDGGHSIKTDEETPVYALVVEKLKTFGPAEREAIDSEMDQVTNVMQQVDQGEAGSIAEACRDSADGCSPITRQVAEAAYELRRNGIEWSDRHAGNIGLDSHGNLKILDLGVTGTQLKEQPKILEGARRKLAKRLLGSV
jgi:hypothetical protein